MSLHGADDLLPGADHVRVRHRPLVEVHCLHDGCLQGRGGPVQTLLRLGDVNRAAPHGREHVDGVDGVVGYDAEVCDVEGQL